MSNPGNIEQFNIQVKRTSDRLRGDSASPPDTQNTDNTIEEGQPGAGGVDTQPAASPAAPSQGRKKGGGGKRSRTASKAGAAETTSAPEVRLTTTREETTPRGPVKTKATGTGDIQTRPEAGDSAVATRKTATEISTAPEGGNHEAGDRAMSGLTRDDLIAPETFDRTTTGRDIREQHT